MSSLSFSSTVAKAPRSKVAAKPAKRTARCGAKASAESPMAAIPKVGAALALSLALNGADMVSPPAAHAGYAGLEPCATNKKFAKNQAKTIKGLTRRQKTFEKGSAPYLALQDTIDKTNTRFDKYKKSNLLCGADGYPHLIVDGNLDHLGEFFVPAVGFLYVAGWIGYVGRKYVIAVKEEAKIEGTREKEIIIDVPLATSLAWTGATWPIDAIKELRDGTLTEDAENITVSPR